MKTAKASNLVNNFPKFSGQNEEIQLEIFVRQIEHFADLVQWTDNEDGENSEICYLFRRLFEGQGQFGEWSKMKKRSTSTFGTTLKACFKNISQPKIKHWLLKKIERFTWRQKETQMPRVIQGVTEEIDSFEDPCWEEIAKIMKKVPNPEENQMLTIHSLEWEDSTTLAKTMFISGARVALISVLVRQNPSSFTEAIQTAVQMEQKWMKIKLVKQGFKSLGTWRTMNWNTAKI